MFTGIIRSKGVITDIQGDTDLKVLKISAPGFIENKKIGDSIAVDGACLTVKSIDKDIFTVEIMPETMMKTTVNLYIKDATVNLEDSLKMGDTIEGHFVSGHVDFTGEVVKIITGKSTVDLIISIPEEFYKFFAIKGSVTVNGVSLTISGLIEGQFKVSVIPETIKNTNLGNIKKNTRVNVEVDMISRYLNSLLESKERQISHDFLKERGFI